jgi:hypothetical protein
MVVMVVIIILVVVVVVSIVYFILFVAPNKTKWINFFREKRGAEHLIIFIN